MQTNPVQLTSGDKPELFTVWAQDVPFTLTRTQIEFDSPNHFTTCFDSGFVEGSTNLLKLNCDPEVFAIIKDYLSGYEILPLDQKSFERPVGLIKTKLNREAEYLHLQSLQEMLPPSRPTSSIVKAFRLPSNFGMILEWEELPHIQEESQKIPNGCCLVLRDVELDFTRINSLLGSTHDWVSVSITRLLSREYRGIGESEQQLKGIRQRLNFLNEALYTKLRQFDIDEHTCTSVELFKALGIIPHDRAPGALSKVVAGTTQITSGVRIQVEATSNNASYTSAYATHRFTLICHSLYLSTQTVVSRQWVPSKTVGCRIEYMNCSTVERAARNFFKARD